MQSTHETNADKERRLEQLLVQHRKLLADYNAITNPMWELHVKIIERSQLRDKAKNAEEKRLINDDVLKLKREYTALKITLQSPETKVKEAQRAQIGAQISDLELTLYGQASSARP